MNENCAKTCKSLLRVRRRRMRTAVSREDQYRDKGDGLFLKGIETWIRPIRGDHLEYGFQP